MRKLPPPGASRARTATASGPTGWLAAYVVGLTYSGRDEQSCIDLLVAAAGGDRGLLRAAHERLATLPLADPSAGRRAARLLTTAIGDIDRRHGTGRDRARRPERSLP